MCRWMSYVGGAIPIEDLLFKTKHNLIDQSMASRSKETPTNGDGFGLGWYGNREQPGVFRSIRPAWNDANLRDLAAQIESRLFIAHVRATSLATVQETNCHPFRYGKWLFVHNGEIHEVERSRRDLLMQVDPKYFENILGSTDSEVMFHLALTFGLEQNPPLALARMAECVERIGRKHGTPEALWMTVGVSDGETLYGVRYASDGEAPTLYYSRNVMDVYNLNPAVAGKFGSFAHAVVSEPVGVIAEVWQAVPQSSVVKVSTKNKTVEVTPFAPKA